MSTVNNIRSVAKYESKLLMRSWFYRIFSVLSILFLGIFNAAALMGDDSGFWMMKALPSSIPYINLLLLNTGQAVIAVFLASEFLKTDRKLDTSEVFYVHPLSNAEYVAGKMWGNLTVFVRLDLLILAVVAVFNLASGTPLDWVSYITYFFLICVPTLIYILGLSVALMLIFRNQAITFVVLLGYIALTLFYISDRFYFLFDYMVYNLPLVKSSIVGFTGLAALVNHRCIYLLFGLGFISLAIFLFRRLPNTKYGRYGWLALSACFFAGGAMSAYRHVSAIGRDASLRARYTEVNNRYVHTPRMVVERYDITVEQREATIAAEAVMSGTALETSAVFTFCLHPSLELREVTENGRDLAYSRESQIILVDFGREVARGDSVSLTMKYDGRIDNAFCYLDIPAEILQETYSNVIFRIDKQYCFQTDDYVLLTPETYWYPRPGTSYSSESPDWQQVYFSRFRLTVKTRNGLRALSQGTQKWPLTHERPEPAPPDVPEESAARRMRWRPTQDADGTPPQAAGENQGRAPDGTPARTPERGDGRSRDRAADRASAGDRERGMDGAPARTAERGADGNRERGAGGGAAARNAGRGMDGMSARNAAGGGSGNRERGTDGASARRGEGGERRSPRRSAEREARRRGQAADSVPNAATGDRRRPDDAATTASSPKKKPSAGKQSTSAGDSLFIFETDFPAPAVTLIIGDYEQKKITVDDTEYSIWYLRGHDYFSSVFEAIADTIPSQIRERRRAIESAYSLDYSFRRFSIVEAPVQFFSYARTWTQAQEKMQPEMILVPEKGCMFYEANVAGRVKNEKKWAKWNGQDISDGEAAIRTLNAFLRFFEQAESNFNWSQERGTVNVTVKPNPYFIFPQLYNFRYNIFSSEWPIANRLIELYLQDKTDNHGWMRQMNGISNYEKANLLAAQYSFKELLTDTEHRDLLDNVIALKANALFAPAERTVGYKEYRDSLREVLRRNIFANLRFEMLLDTLGEIAGEDLRRPLAAWESPSKLPVYIIEAPEVTQLSNRDRDVYIVKLQITNDSDYDGLINLETVTGGQNALYDPRAKRKVALAAHETKRFVSVWDEAPRNIVVNTLVSANLPNIVTLPVTNLIRERNRPVDMEGDFVVANASRDLPGEVIVDNEDSLLFELSSPAVVGLLPRWLDRVDDGAFRYAGVSNWRPPLQWTLTTNDKYYGAHVRSACVVKSGNGAQTATWKIPVPASGQYELYYYVYKPEDIRRGGRGRGRDGQSDAEYGFKVIYDGDSEDAYINLRRSEDGWNMLGAYYFNEDTVKVVLTNDCRMRSVTADAVKIVRR
jgi:hypothetical protein